MRNNIPASVGMSVEDVDTPCLLVDLDALERNIDKLGRFMKERGLRHRAHAKTHKSSDITVMQIERGGACGVCCQKVSEAEALVTARKIRELRETTGQHGEQLVAIVEQLSALIEQVGRITARHTDLAAAVSEDLAPRVGALQQLVTEELGRLRGELEVLLAERQERDKTKNAPVDWATLTAEQAAALDAHTDTVLAYVTRRFDIATDKETCTPIQDGSFAIEEREGVPYARLTLDYRCSGATIGHEVRSSLFPDEEEYVRGTRTIVTYDLDLRSGSAALGARALAEAGERLELAVREGAPVDLEAEVGRLLAEVARAEQGLHALRDAPLREDA